MKKYNILIPLILGVAFVSCSNKKNLEKSVISIDTSQLKQLYQGNDNLNLQLKTSQDAQLDSVAYFLNDKRIGSVKNNDLLTYNLSKEKLGKVALKAIAYADDNSKELNLGIEIAAPARPKTLMYNLVNVYPHDQEAYTQGLEFHDGALYESTGNGEGGGSSLTGGTGKKGVSSVRQLDPKTGKVLRIHKLPMEIFGEGCTILNNKLYQLTYQNNEAYRYNLETFEKEKTFKYFKNMEGWGITNDGTYLFMTNGTEKIYKVDPETFEEIDHINVYSHAGPLQFINELEWVDGRIYANVYGENFIVVINPNTGAIESLINFQDALLNKTTYHADRDVFNGIAYNPSSKTFFVTGKNWDKMFEIQVIE